MTASPTDGDMPTRSPAATPAAGGGSAWRGDRDAILNVLASMPDGVCISDEHCEVTYANTALEKQFGPWAGKKCHQYLRDRDSVCPSCTRPEVLAGQTVRREWYSPKTGRTYEAVDTPLRGSDGSVSKLSILHDIGERKQAEEQTASLAKFPSENPLPVLRITRDGELLYANAAGAVLLEGDARPPGQAVPDFWREQVEHAFRLGTTCEMTVEHEARTFAFSLVPIDDGGYVNLYGQDITERKAVEEALRKGETLYRAVVEGQTELICRFLPDMTLSFVNDAYCRYFRRDRDVLIGGSFLTFVPEEDRERFRAHFLSQDAGTGGATYEHRVIAAFGEVRWQQWTCRAVQGAHGRVVEYQAVGRDVTDRRLAEAALRQSEVRYRTLVETIPHGISESDTDGVLTFGNRAYQKMLGYGEGELLGTSIQDLLAEESDKHDLALYLETLVQYEPPPVTYTTRDRTKDGHVIDVEVDWNYKRDEHGAVTGFISVITDVTERRRAEQALQVSHRILDIANRHSEMLPLLEELVGEIQTLSGCPAVGIRILDADQTVSPPASDSFCQGFQDPGGWLSTDPFRRVLSGRTKPQQPSFTDGGSFCVTGRAPLIAALSEGRGPEPDAMSPLLEFESVALVPIRFGERIVGVIHVGDVRTDRMSAEAVGLLEHMGVQLGAAVERVRATQQLRRAHDDLEKRVAERTLELSRINAELTAEISHRWEVERALRENHALLERIFDNTHLAIASLDTEFNFARVNRAYAEGDGQSPDAYPGRNYFDLYNDPEIRTVFGKVLESGRPYFAYEHAFTYPSHPEMGVTYWDWSVAPVREGDGQVDGLVFCRIDVTDRKLAQDEIRVYQDQLRSLASQLALTEEWERKRIATALHDHIGQTLALSKIQLGALRASLPPDAAASVGEVRGLIEECISSMRSLIFELSPPVLHELGLEPALARLAEHMGTRYNLQIRFEDDGESKPLADDVRVVVFQAARELLVNVVKHANATEVGVSVQRDDRQIALRIRDDGKGFDATETGPHIHKGGGFGLFSLRERLSHLGGGFGIRSEAGRGTVATVTAPLLQAATGDGA